MGAPANIHTNLILQESRLIDLHFVADSLRLASFYFFSGELRKTILFRNNRRWGRFGHSRASKVTDIGANRKLGYDFLLVHNSNFGPILHRFPDMTGFMCYLPHPYSTLILGVFPLHQIAHVGHQPEQRP